jgi:hypothetical protein
MPTVFRWNGIRFHFFANEGDPREPLHIHADRNDATAKLWLYPDVSVAKNFGYSRRELVELTRIVESRRAEIERTWNEFFSQNS